MSRPTATGSHRKRAIGYIRVSSVGGRAGAEYHTLEIQRASIERVCEQRGYELVDVLTDENRSGRSRRRPQFQEALNRVLGGEAEAIAVWKVSRFSRNWAEAAADTEQLTDNGKDLISGEEGFDTTTTGGKALLRMLFVLAAWELDVLREGWESLKAKVVAERGSTLGHAGLGYVSGEGGVLQPDPLTAPLVVKLFERRAAGASIGALARWLDEVQPKPSSAWDGRAVRRILSSRRYLGEARWREVVNDGAHEPLVSADVWWAAQRAAESDPEPVERSPNRTFPLTRILRCSSCGGSMSGSAAAGRGGQRRPNYICSHRAKGCSAPMSVSAPPVEAWVMSQMDALMASIAERGSFEDVGSAQSQAVELLREVEAAIEEASSFESRRTLGKDWINTIATLNEERDALAGQLNEERRRSGLPARSVEWADLNEAARWIRLRDAVEHVRVDPPRPGGAPVGRLHLVWRHGDETHLSS